MDEHEYVDIPVIPPKGDPFMTKVVIWHQTDEAVRFFPRYTIEFEPLPISLN